MSDRVLLELAAKATGIEGQYESWCYQGFNEGIRITMIDGSKALMPWNPIRHDSQAFRLAVDLAISVTPYPIYEHPKHSVIAWRKSLNDSRGEVVELYGNDPQAATRRAIVRAAAEIGRAMP